MKWPLTQPWSFLIMHKYSGQTFLRQGAVKNHNSQWNGHWLSPEVFSSCTSTVVRHYWGKGQLKITSVSEMATDSALKRSHHAQVQWHIWRREMLSSQRSGNWPLTHPRVFSSHTQVQWSNISGGGKCNSHNSQWWLLTHPRVFSSCTGAVVRHWGPARSETEATAVSGVAVDSPWDLWATGNSRTAWLFTVRTTRLLQDHDR